MSRTTIMCHATSRLAPRFISFMDHSGTWPPLVDFKEWLAAEDPNAENGVYQRLRDGQIVEVKHIANLVKYIRTRRSDQPFDAWRKLTEYLQEMGIECPDHLSYASVARYLMDEHSA